MVKVDVISGFLGAGKTTLIKKMFESDISKEKVVLIENEFGEIGIDGTFLKGAGVEIKEINSGCICCSLVGDFESSIKEVINKFNPDRIIIEPSGVGKLSDIVKAILKVDAPLKLNIVVTVVDGGKCKMYIKNFGEFYIDQVKDAHNVVVSKADKLSEEKILTAVEQIRAINDKCSIITTPITELSGEKLIEVLENGQNQLDSFIESLKNTHEEEHHHHHHHHDDDDDEECCCHHHHHDEDEEHECCHHDHDDDDEDEEECCHHHHNDHDDEEDDEHECCHHHHDHDDEEEEEHHHHHHDHDEDGDDEECCCHHHDHDHEHHHHGHEGHHHADEVFQSWGIETAKSYTKEELSYILEHLCSENCGIILRSKGVVKASDSKEWYYFDLVYGDYEIRLGAPDVIGKVCVIGSKINEAAIQELFNK